MTKGSKKPKPSKKQAPTRPSKGRELGTKPTGSVSITRARNTITISYEKPEEVLPHLLDLASDFAYKHFGTAELTDPSAADVLGTAAARNIVGTCANSTCWSCTIADLSLDPNQFQTCVFNGVESAGYSISRVDIPTAPSTQMYTVVMAIQNAKK